MALQSAEAQVLIRQLGERVVAILRAQAQRHGVSLEQSQRDLLTAAAPDPSARPAAGCGGPDPGGS